MYLIKPFEPSIYLLDKEGGVRRFANKAAACRELGYRRIVAMLGPANSAFWVSFLPIDYYYKIEDQYGNKLTISDFKEFKTARKRAANRFNFDYNGEGPVPFVHKRRGGNSLFRRPKTTQERRTAQDVGEGEPLPRGARRTKQLVNAWDDVCRSGIRRHTSWKQHRKTQWKS